MYYLILKFLVVLTVVLSVALADGETYSTKYDSIDLDKTLQNDRLFNKFVDCLLADDEKGCHGLKEGLFLKEKIADALETECSKCSDAQKKGIEKFIKYLLENKKDVWEKICKKYDPENKYRTKYEEYLSQKKHL